MFKEKGYDKFLAECIRKGREDVANGRVYTFQESKAIARQVLERKARETLEFEREVSKYT